MPRTSQGRCEHLDIRLEWSGVDKGFHLSLLLPLGGTKSRRKICLTSWVWRLISLVEVSAWMCTIIEEETTVRKDLKPPRMPCPRLITTTPSHRWLVWQVSAKWSICGIHVIYETRSPYQPAARGQFSPETTKMACSDIQCTITCWLAQLFGLVGPSPRCIPIDHNYTDLHISNAR